MGLMERIERAQSAYLCWWRRRLRQAQAKVLRSSTAKTDSDLASAGTPAPNRVQYVDEKRTSERSSDTGGASIKFWCRRRGLQKGSFPLEPAFTTIIQFEGREFFGVYSVKLLWRNCLTTGFVEPAGATSATQETPIQRTKKWKGEVRVIVEPNSGSSGCKVERTVKSP